MTNQLNWQHIGNDDKPAIVLLHGWGTNMSVWESIVDSLSQSFQLHLVDLPGYGKSPEQKLTTLSELSDIIYQQSPKQAFWLGWSLGGLIATHIALNHANSVKGLITIASSPCFIAQDNRAGLEPSIFEQFEINLQKNPLITLQRFIALQCLGDLHAKTIQRKLLSILDKNVSITTLQFGLTLLKQTDLTTKLQQLTVPHLQILGSKDKIVPIDIAKHHSHIIDNTSHVPFLSNPERVINLITDFISITISNAELSSL